jgi:hypothetical protein
VEFRCRNVDNDIVYFNLNQCPVLIYDDLVALKKITGSKFLVRNSIARFSTSLNAWEFDNVVDELGNNVGTIVYNNGFYIYLDSGCRTTFDKEKYKVVPADFMDLLAAIKFKDRTEMLFKSEGTIFSFSDIVDCNEFGIFTTKKLDYPITFERVQMFTGFRDNSRLLFYGDEFRDGVIVEHNGMPYLKGRDVKLLEDAI